MPPPLPNSRSAPLLSLAFPGWGQWTQRRPLPALMYATCALVMLLILLALAATFLREAWPLFRNLLTGQLPDTALPPSTKPLALALACQLGIHVASIYDAWWHGVRSRRSALPV